MRLSDFLPCCSSHQAQNFHSEEPSTSSTKAPSAVTATPAPISFEPYSAARAQSLFTQYADSDDPEVIGPEGFTQLCSDADVPLEGALPLIMAWQLDCKEMAKISKAEWTAGTASLHISSLGPLKLAAVDLEKLLIEGQPPAKKTAGSTGSTKKKPRSDELYDRNAYWVYAQDPIAAFKKLYAFCFALAKPPQARNIDMEVC
ncbi:hypothetical protein HGRIS_013611 [Hohenbuehelia grisea]|uniref:Defective in cullin neddylation protein n=1 Tax=Hohenbuehelia grisea TaxID=104357 RepID=A0ABR3IW39_9AGAR